MSPQRRSPATADITEPGFNSGLDPFKLCDPAGNRDPTGVLKPIHFLSFTQQLPKQRVVEVYHRHQNPVQLAVILTHVNRQMPLRNLILNRVRPDRDVARAEFRCTTEWSHPSRKLAGPREKLRRGLPRWRWAQTTVSGSGREATKDPFSDPGDPLAELELHN